jgi:Fe-S cluster assembly protein SufD
VHIEPLDEALARNPDALREHLGRGVDPKYSGFAALNTALFEQGLLVEIEPGAAPEAPIEVEVENRCGTDEDGVASFTRLLVVVGAGGRATLVERYAGRGSYLESAVTEIVLGPGAELRHVRLQRESQSAWHMASLDVRQERDSRYASHSIALGGRLARLEITATLAGEGAECALDGLYLARDSQLLDHQTLVDHAAPHTTSRELYKGILDGRSRGVFRGRVHVRPDAQKIDASQTNRSLLLSDDAIANTKPQLEIYADDVKCSHGASIGQLSDDALFYLRSRGVSLSQARALLSFAFASEVVRSLPEGPIRAEIEELTVGWLPIGAVR